MREMIETLRERILAEARNLVPADEIEEQKFARHPGRGDRADEPGNDGHTWESYLWKRDKVLVVLSYNVKNLNGDFNLQSITMEGHRFNTVRLFIFDDNPRPANVGITPQQLVDRLRREYPALPGENASYFVEPSARRAEFRPTQTGHVLDLYVRDTGHNWTIPTIGQIDQVAPDLAEKVKAMLDALLPVAEFYADNREALLAGRI